jgi:hypothetical protein
MKVPVDLKEHLLTCLLEEVVAVLEMLEAEDFLPLNINYK